MKDLIQEGRKIQETFKKNVVNEQGAASAFFNKIRSWYTGHKSIYGKWYMDGFEEKKNTDNDYYILYKPKKSFESKIKSQIAPALGNYEIVAEVRTFRPVETEITFHFYSDRTITFSREKKTSPTKVEHTFKKMVMDESELVSVGDMMYAELQKEVDYFLRSNKEEFRKFLAIFRPRFGGMWG